jgi:hypothetical protein
LYKTAPAIIINVEQAPAPSPAPAPTKNDNKQQSSSKNVSNASNPMTSSLAATNYFHNFNYYNNERSMSPRYLDATLLEFNPKHVDNNNDDQVPMPVLPRKFVDI